MSNSDNNIEIFALNFIIAGVTSSIAKTITAPMERIKLILQNQNSSVHILTGERRRYRGMIDCLRRLPKEQGILSLWRGNGTNVLRYIPTQALNFAFHDFFKYAFYRTVKEEHSVQGVMVTFLAGGLAGACSIFTMYPLKFCQTRLSVDMGSVTSTSKENRKGLVKREFDGLTDCFVKLYQKEGLPGFYQGFHVALIGSVLYRSMYFGMFDSLKDYYRPVKKETQKLSVLTEVLIAEGVTTLSGYCVYPFDTVGRRLMMECGQPKELKLLGTTWNAIKVMYTQEGLSSFYKGAWANCLRSTGGALVLVFYDEFLYYTQWKQWVHKR